MSESQQAQAAAGSLAAAPAWFRAAVACTPQTGRVDVDGVGLHYRAWGLEHTHRPTLLLVHGFGGHSAWWDAVAPALATRHRVYAIDLSGMGDSDHRESYAADTAARDIVGAIESLGLGPVIGIGHSAGGLRLLTACAERPDLFTRLIVIDSYVVFEGIRHPERPAHIKGDKVYPDRATALGRYRLLPDQPNIHPWALDHIAQQSLREVEGGWRWKFDSKLPVGAHLETPGDQLLPRVACPVHYIHGEASMVVSPELARRIVSALPQGHGPIGVPGGHHHLMIDEPVALIAMLRALLS